MPRPDRVHNSGRSLAAARLLLALALVLFSTVDAGHPDFEPQVDDVGALLYTIFSASMLAVSTRSWWWDYRLFWPATIVDFLAFALIPPHIATSAYGYFAGWTALASLVMIRTILFAGRYAPLLAFFVLNGAAYALSLLGRFHTPLSVNMDVWDNLRQLLSLSFITAFILTVAERLRAFPRIRGFSGDPPPSVELMAQEAAEFFARTFGAMSYMLCWQPGERGRHPVVVAKGVALAPGDKDGPFCQETSDYDKWPAIFVRHGARGLAIDSEGSYRRVSSSNGPDATILRSGFERGLSLPFEGYSGNGRLILAELAELNLDSLRYASGVPPMLATPFDSFAWQEVRKNAALSDMRGAMARDLHDSVAQSLAGASFWLKATAGRKDVGEAARADILKAAEALDKENSEIRQIILDLRQAGPRQWQNCAAALREVLGRFAQFWDVAISFETDSEGALADSEFLVELNQLAREAISNAVRHGGADRIDVTLNRCGNGFEFSVRDNGRGIDDNVTPVSLLERVSRLGGRLSVRSEPIGTTVAMNLGSEHFQ